MFNTIKSKIVFSGILAVLIPVIIILFLINMEKNNISKIVVLESMEQVKENIQGVALDAFSLCESQQELLAKVMQANMNVTNDIIKNKGGLFLSSEQVNWKAIDQNSRNEINISLPRINTRGTLIAPGLWLGQNYSKNDFTPVVDEVAKLVGGTCTIFQRMNDEGDMLRVATNVITGDGKRAIGTFISARDEKNVKNAIIESVLSGRDYVGRAFVVDAWYITNYSPIKDDTNNVIGMSYVGVKQESVESLRKAIMNIKIGETGYAFILGGSGAQRGQYIISYKGESDGVNVYDAKDSSGRMIVKEMIDLAKNASGKPVYYDYYWKDAKEKVERKKIVSLLYFEKWDWVIGITAYLDEFQKTADVINSGIYNLYIHSIYAALISMIISLLLTFFIGNGIGKNIEATVAAIKKLTSNVMAGNLSERGDKTQVAIEFAPIIEGVNSVMDTYNQPVEMAVDYIEKISNGIIPEKIKQDYSGDFNKIKDGLNLLIDVLTDFSVQMKEIYTQHKAGEIEVKLNLEKFKGIYSDIGESVFNTINYHVSTILKVLSLIEDYGVKGDFTKELEKFPGKQAIMNKMIDALKNNLVNIIAETKMLVAAALEGRLKIRGDESKFIGDYREIIKGINDTLDAVNKPVTEATAILEKMAQGDLSLEMKGEYNGDHAILKNSLNLTINSMNDILSQFMIAVDQVDTGSRQVSDASQSLSQVSAESASSLEEISSSMQEIGSQSTQNADSAVQAQSLSHEAKMLSEEGNSQVKLMDEAMREMNESSKNVTKIIKSIDEIAFQTNLLALNAAVEAARAGKHGKGFTVVAEEVRNLAQRSAKAAKETAEMIENSIQKTESGAKIMSNTSQALLEIQNSVTKVSDLIGEIAAASKEQKQGIAQINQGLQQIDQSIQQNTATAEETAAASEELSSQAVELKSMITKFILKNKINNKNEVIAYVGKRKK